MADKGIGCSPPMVRALLDGRKTQTRRLIRPQPPSVDDVRKLSGSGYHWFKRKLLDREWSVAGPVWAVRKITGEKLPKLRIPYAPGDRLYVREAWSHTGQGVWDIQTARMVGPGGVIYRADGDLAGATYWPSIHMPREFSRMFLTVTDVRVQQVQEISLGDICAEGLASSIYDFKPVQRGFEAWENLWNSLHTAEGERWNDNPWIVAVTFDVHRGNIDAVAA